MFAQEQKVILPKIRDDLKLLETSIAEDGSKRWLLFDPIQNKYFDIEYYFEGKLVETRKVSYWKKL